MELPAEVLIHNETLDIKGGTGTLLRVSANGYYEVNCRFGEKVHRTLFPVASTVLIQRDSESTDSLAIEVER